MTFNTRYGNDTPLRLRRTLGWLSRGGGKHEIHLLSLTSRCHIGLPTSQCLPSAVWLLLICCLLRSKYYSMYLLWRLPVRYWISLFRGFQALTGERHTTLLRGS
jgi:hypothetical protein